MRAECRNVWCLCVQIDTLTLALELNTHELPVHLAVHVNSVRTHLLSYMGLCGKVLDYNRHVTRAPIVCRLN